MAIKPIQIDGRTIPVDVTEDGDFRAEVGGQCYRAPTYKALTEKLRTHVRSAGRIALPVTLIEHDYHGTADPVFRHIVLTGIHGGSQNVLYRAEGSQRTEQLCSFNDGVMRRLSPAEMASYTALVRAQHKARKAVKAWEETHQVDPHTLIEEAQAALEKKAGGRS